MTEDADQSYLSNAFVPGISRAGAPRRTEVTGEKRPPGLEVASGLPTRLHNINS
ncbi:MAG: hypothetical protein LUO80_09355 [Methylococcaceae bacterium]|nr:hypothetical protein [Methylococcaceae bacterium]